MAIVLGVHEVRKFRRDQMERQQELVTREIDARRAQAERVAGWLRFSPDPYSPVRQFHASADVVNASAGPIYEAKVHGATVDGAPLIVCSVGMIPPGETGHVHLPPVDERPGGQVGAHIVFRDAAERWWERDADGHLTEHDCDPWPRPAHAVRESCHHGHACA